MQKKSSSGTGRHGIEIQLFHVLRLKSCVAVTFIGSELLITLRELFAMSRDLMEFTYELASPPSQSRMPHSRGGFKAKTVFLSLLMMA